MPRVRQSEEELAGLASRRDALRQAAGIPGADLAALLDAALTELDGAIGDLGAGDAAGEGGDPAGDGAQARAERLLLHGAFQQAPVPMFLLEQDGTIRRANVRAAELLGVPVGYATGRPLTDFLDVPSRAAVRSQFAALRRTGGPRRTAGRVLTSSGPVGAMLTAASLDLPGEEPLVIVTALAGEVPGPPDAGPKRGPDQVGEDGTRDPGTGVPGSPGDPAVTDAAIRAMTRRLDLVTEVTRVLLDNAAFSEAVTIRRCARLLAGPAALADWVIVDLDREGRLRRQTVARGGTGDDGDVDLTAVLRDTDPEPGSLPWQVVEGGSAVLLAHAADDGLLGAGPDGRPLLPALGVTSLLCVPVRDDEARYGTLTLARLPDAGSYALADLALAERLGSHLGTAIGVSRRFRERSQAAQVMQASLLPTRLPDPEGLEFAAAYLAATGWQETGADFYDAFPVAGGWAVAVGDVSGRGQDAAAVTAATRHAIRAFAVTRAGAPRPGGKAGPRAAGADTSSAGSVSRRGRPGRPGPTGPAGAGPAQSSPAEVLAAVNDVLLAGEYDDRYVTVRLAFLRRAGDRVHVTLGGAGHPGPAVLRADGRVEVLGAAGRPLGLFAELGPDERELELAPGDLLLFYTDGAVSGRGADLAAFEERLADSLAALAGRPASEVIRAAQALATDFSGDELRDDVTLLAVRALLAGRTVLPGRTVLAGRTR
jgi:serine phosphatase RsbU (regulator of sigma subunit)/PAS domain-containing protein